MFNNVLKLITTFELPSNLITEEELEARIAQIPTHTGPTQHLFTALTQTLTAALNQVAAGTLNQSHPTGRNLGSYCC